MNKAAIPRDRDGVVRSGPGSRKEFPTRAVNQAPQYRFSLSDLTDSER